MAEISPSPARTTATLFSYAERLAAETAPRSAALLLGLRWSFGLPGAGLEKLTEYSLPLNPTPILEALERRGGVRLTQHLGDAELSLYDHLAEDKPAIVAVDSYYLPFGPDYRRIRSSRTVLARRGEKTDEIYIQDLWRPAGEGVLSRTDLDNARNSDVPLDLERDPLFSGRPVDGEWFSVEVTPPTIDDPARWAASLLGILYAEMVQPAVDGRGEYGHAAFQRFLGLLEEKLEQRSSSDKNFMFRRAACLLLRSELTSRLYFCAFLRGAAHWLAEQQLSSEAESYLRSLGHIQGVMDVLAKTLKRRRPEYGDFIRRHLRQAIEAEEHLAKVISSYAEKTGSAADHAP